MNDFIFYFLCAQHFSAIVVGSLPWNAMSLKAIIRTTSKDVDTYLVRQGG